LPAMCVLKFGYACVSVCFCKCEFVGVYACM
jgi:hypothetical protein